MRILRRPEVERKIGLRHSQIYADIRAGTFPPPVRIGRRAVGWREDLVDQWIAAREPVRRGPGDPPPDRGHQ